MRHTTGMTNKEEFDLIKKVREGDNEAYKKLLYIYHNMIYKLIYSNRLNSGDYRIQADDLYQEGCVALLDAAMTYEGDKGASFSTFAYLVIKRRLKRKVREYLGSARTEVYSIDAYETPDYLEEMQSLSVSENPVDYHHSLVMLEDVNSFMSRLSESDREIIRMSISKNTYQDIASTLKISRKKVDNRIYRLRKELKRYLSGEDTPSNSPNTRKTD